MEETKKLFSIVCSKCGQKYETYCTHDELAVQIATEKCECGGELVRDWAFGMGQFKGSGFTKRST